MVECAFTIPLDFNCMPFEEMIRIMNQFSVTSPSEKDNLHDADPTVNERSRIYSCEEKDVLLKHVREYLRELRNTKDSNVDQIYVPCTIRYSLLGICSSSGKIDVSVGVLDNTGPSILNRHSLHPPSWIAIARDDNLTALVASTVWFSLDSCREIWSICDDGKYKMQLDNHLRDKRCNYVRENLVKCFAYQSKKRWGKSKKLLEQGLLCEAYRSLCLTILLSNERHLLVPIVRMSLSLPSCMKSVLDSIDMLLDVLGRDNILSMNIEIIGYSIYQNISLRLREIFASPLLVHLRGGCILLLKTMENFESSLQLDLHMDVGTRSFTSLRQALGTPNRIVGALNFLKCMHSMCKLFKFTLERDIHDNCSTELKDVFERFPRLEVDVMKTDQSDFFHPNFSIIAHRMNILQSVKKTMSKNVMEQVDSNLNFILVESNRNDCEMESKLHQFPNLIEGNINLSTSDEARIEDEEACTKPNDSHFNFQLAASTSSMQPSNDRRKVQSIANMLSFIRFKTDEINIKELQRRTMRSCEDCNNNFDCLKSS